MFDRVAPGADLTALLAAMNCLITQVNVRRGDGPEYIHCTASCWAGLTKTTEAEAQVWLDRYATDLGDGWYEVKGTRTDRSAGCRPPAPSAAGAPADPS